MKCRLKIKSICCFFFLSFFGVFCALSSPVSAVSITTNVDPTGRSWKFSSGLRCTVDDDGAISVITANVHNECNLPAHIGRAIFLRNFYLTEAIPTVAGNYYSFVVGYETNQGLSNIWWNPNVPNDDWVLYEFDEITQDEMLSSSADPQSSDHWATSWKSKFWRITLQAKRTGNTTLMMGNHQGVPRSLMIFDEGQLSVSEVFEYVPTGNSEIVDAVNNPEYIQDEKQDLENQKQEAEDTAEQESSQAESTGTSLLSVVSQFISSFSSASPSSCTVDGSLIPHLPLDSLNLCQNSPPPAITALGSLILIGFIVPLAYNLVKRMLALIGSFQT